jgi:hypothetical protein
VTTTDETTDLAKHENQIVKPPKRPLEDPSSPSDPSNYPAAKRPALDTAAKDDDADAIASNVATEVVSATVATDGTKADRLAASGDRAEAQAEEQEVNPSTPSGAATSASSATIQNHVNSTRTQLTDELQLQSEERPPVAQNDGESPPTTMTIYDAVNEGAQRRLSRARSAIFITCTEASSLFDVFLHNLPTDRQAQYNCSTCRQFINRYGGLALVNDDGTLTSVLWDGVSWTRRDCPEVSEIFQPAIQALCNQIKSAKVIDQYKPIRDQPRTYNVGNPDKGGHNHFYLNIPSAFHVRQYPAAFALVNAIQSAEMLERLVNDFDRNTAWDAQHLLSSHQLSNADNHIAAITHFVDILSVKLPRHHSVRRHNLIFRHAAAAFTGCLSQLRSGPLGVLLRRLRAGVPHDSIQHEWSELTKGENYMRPTADPSIGAITAAEKLFRQLGLTKDDLRRRLLTRAEIQDHVYLWQWDGVTTEAQDSVKDISIFASLADKAIKSSAERPPPHDASASPPPTKISFVRLLATVLPFSCRAWLQLEPRQSLTFMNTGLEGSVPLMQWQTEGNLMSSYVYVEPLPVENHNLRSKAWNEITGVMPMPWLWDVPGVAASIQGRADSPSGLHSLRKHELLSDRFQLKKGFRFLLLLDGIEDKDITRLDLFPADLKSEVHGVRKVIERYSNEGVKEVLDKLDVQSKGGYAGGVQMFRGNRSMLVRTLGRENGEIEIWEVDRFEDGLRKNPVVSRGTQMDQSVANLGEAE